MVAVKFMGIELRCQQLTVRVVYKRLAALKLSSACSDDDRRGEQRECQRKNPVIIVVIVILNSNM